MSYIKVINDIFLIVAVWVAFDIHASSFQPARSKRPVKKPEWEKFYRDCKVLPTNEDPLLAGKKRVSFSDSLENPDLDETRVLGLAASIWEIEKWDKFGNFNARYNAELGMLTLELTIENINSWYESIQEEVLEEAERLKEIPITLRDLFRINSLIDELNYILNILKIEGSADEDSVFSTIKEGDEKQKVLKIFCELLTNISLYIDILNKYKSDMMNICFEEKERSKSLDKLL